MTRQTTFIISDCFYFHFAGEGDQNTCLAIHTVMYSHMWEQPAKRRVSAGFNNLNLLFKTIMNVILDIFHISTGIKKINK